MYLFSMHKNWITAKSICNKYLLSLTKKSNGFMCRTVNVGDNKVVTCS